MSLRLLPSGRRIDVSNMLLLSAICDNSASFRKDAEAVSGGSSVVMRTSEEIIKLCKIQNEVETTLMNNGKSHRNLVA